MRRARKIIIFCGALNLVSVLAGFAARADFTLEGPDDFVSINCPNCTPPPKLSGLAGAVRGSQGTSSTGTNMIDDLQGRLKTAISYIPSEDTRKAVTTYLEVMRPGEYHGSDMMVGSSNSGLAATLQSIYNKPENSCFRSAAHDFYDEINRISRRARRSENDASEGGGRSFEGPGRPTLQRSAGQGSDEKLETGWVWDTAMRHAHGDANVAMKLIGLCGNDDTQQPVFSYYDNSPKAIEDNREIHERNAADKKRLTAELMKAYGTFAPQSVIKGLQMRIQHLESSMKHRGNLETMDCPDAKSDFYLAKGLGEQADIPQSLKDKVLAVEGHSGNADKIPSKYYHVYGSALVACEMIERGVAPGKVTETSEQAARLYRGIRLCQAVREINAKKSIVENIVSRAPSPTSAGMTSEKALDELAAKLKANPSFCDEGSGAYSPTDLCLRLELKFSNDALKKLTNARTRMDAAELYSAWTMGGKEVAGVTIPCSDVHLFGPKDRMNPTDNWLDRMAQPAGWSKERFVAASRVVATWDADFEWTIAQHKIGAKFAKAVCKKKDGPTDYAPLCHNASSYGSAKEGTVEHAKNSPNLETKRAGE